MTMSDECVRLIAIPPMQCGPKYCIKKLPTNIPTALDTTLLAGYYEFNSADFNISWSDYTTYTVVDGVVVSSPPSPCDVTTDVADTDYSYIDWISVVRRNAGSRDWIKEIECSDNVAGDGSDLESNKLPAAVAYATNKPFFLPTPFFNPNQTAGMGGGGGGDVEGDDEDAGSGFVGRVVGYVSPNTVKVVRVNMLGSPGGELFEYPYKTLNPTVGEGGVDRVVDDPEGIIEAYVI